MKAPLPSEFWNRRQNFTINSSEIFTHLMFGHSLSKQTDLHGPLRTDIGKKNIDPSIRFMVKKMERWAINKGLTMSGVLTANVLFAVNFQ